MPSDDNDVNDNVSGDNDIDAWHVAMTSRAAGPFGEEASSALRSNLVFDGPLTSGGVFFKMDESLHLLFFISH